MFLNSKILVVSALLLVIAGCYSTVWALPLSLHVGVDRPSTIYRGSGDTVGEKIDPLSMGLERRNNPRPVHVRVHKEKGVKFVNAKGPPKGVPIPKLTAKSNFAKASPPLPSHASIIRKPTAKKVTVKRPLSQIPKGRPHQPNGWQMSTKKNLMGRKPAPSVKKAKNCLERGKCTTTQMLQRLQTPVKTPQPPRPQPGRKSPVYAMHLGPMQFQESAQGDEEYGDE